MGVGENTGTTDSTATAGTTTDSRTADSAAAGDGAATAFATADVARYPIAPGYRVNVRRGPGTQYGIVRTLPYGMSVPVYCQKPGEWISGPYGTSNLWDNIANGEFVSDAYVRTGSDGYIAPRCD